MRRLKNNTVSGFTLTEMLVAVTILGVIMVIIADILLQTLRSESKTQLLNQIKQNGQSIIDKMVVDIREAQQVRCVNNDSAPNGFAAIVVYNIDPYNHDPAYKPTYTKYIYIPQIGSSANGYFRRNIFLQTDIPSGTADEDLCSVSNFGLQADNLSDYTDTQRGVSFTRNSAGDPIFTKQTIQGYQEMVSIKFYVKEAVKAGQTYENVTTPGGVQFSTSVILRGARY